MASRRRMKASELTSIELNWFISNLQLKYKASYLSISTFSSLRKKYMHIKNWQFKILSCAIYVTSRHIVSDNDVMLIDRDYSEDVMKKLSKYITLLFEYSGKSKVTIDVGTSFNEVIAIADIVAGCCRQKCAKHEEIKVEKIEDLMRFLK